MKKKPYITALASALLGLITLPVHADLAYYLPFDDAGAASLDNEGTLGGTANVNTGSGWAALDPTPSTSTAPGIGGSHSEQFTGSNASARAVTLPGSSNQFNLDSASSKMTLATWVYRDGTTASEYGIATKLVNADQSGWGFSITGDGELKFNYALGGSGSSGRNTVETIGTETWTHVAVTWDTGSTNALKFYINGQLATIDGGNFTGTSELGANTSSIQLGVNSSTLFNSLYGNLDDFAMWDTLFTDAQIRALNTAPAAITGYDAGVVNELFKVADGDLTSATISGQVWTQNSGFDVGGRTVGDTWEDAGEYYIWLTGDSENAVGVSTIPEASQAALLIGVTGLSLALIRRRHSGK